mgnify:CR=1 FL=1
MCSFYVSYVSPPACQLTFGLRAGLLAAGGDVGQKNMNP